MNDYVTTILKFFSSSLMLLAFRVIQLGWLLEVGKNQKTSKLRNLRGGGVGVEFYKFKKVGVVIELKKGNLLE